MTTGDTGDEVRSSQLTNLEPQNTTQTALEFNGIEKSINIRQTERV